MEKRKRLAIIGAGPMGLALAHSLSPTWRTVVYERDDRLGGMSASFDFDGVTLERYYHFINRPDRHLLALLNQVGLADSLRWVPTKMGFYRQDAQGRRELQAWGNPLALLRFRGIPLLTRLRYGFHAYACQFLGDLSDLDEISASRWIARWEGEKGYDYFWRFLFEKKFFQFSEPLSAAWIASRIRRVAKSRTSMFQESLGYLEGGSQALLTTLAEAIVRQGGEIRLNHRVERIDVEAGRRGGTVIADGQREEYDVIASTIPLPYVGGMIPGLPEEYRRALDSIHNVGCACAVFRLEQPLTDNFWLNVDVPDWDIPGIIEYSNLRPMRQAHVYVPFYMPHNQPNWTLSDAELLQKARRYLAAVNPLAAATERAGRVFRYEYAQPICPPGFSRRLPPYQTGLAGVFVADTSHAFPEDRSITESVRIAQELAHAILSAS